MEWIYQGRTWEAPKDFTSDDYYGFVYQITNRMNGMKYIGKKFFWSKRTLPITKTRKRRKKTLVESDWREYYGSSKRLQEDIDQMGKEAFHRDIIELCATKGECAYLEAKIQFDRDVLLQDDYYNGIINVRIGGNSVKFLKEKHVQSTKNMV